MLNSVTLVGCVGADPEIKYFDSGKSKATFRIAVDRIGKNKEPDWFHIEAWGQPSEFVAKHVKKGSCVGVVGRLENQKWTQEGQPRQKTVVIASECRFVGKKGSGAAKADDSGDDFDRPF